MKLPTNTYFLILVVLVIMSSTAAPISAQSKPENHLQFESKIWDTTSGLPQNTVRAIVQTPDRYIWLATMGGLVRFDGVEFDVFDLARNSHLGSNRIRSLYSGADGVLWVGTEQNGLVRYEDGIFTKIPSPELIDSIAPRSEGGFWVSSTRSVWSVESGGFRSIFEDIEPPIASLLPINLFTDSRGWLWIATGGGSLGVFSENQLRWLPVAHDAQMIVEDSAHRIWVNTDNGIISIDAGLTITEFPFGFPVFTLQVDSEDGLRMSTERGAALYKDGHLTILGNNLLPFEQRGLDTAKLIPIVEFIDHEDNTWFGTMRRGLIRLRESQLSGYGQNSGLRGAAVGPVAASTHMGILVGNDGHLMRFENRQFSPVRFPELESIHQELNTIVSDENDDIFLGKGPHLFRIRNHELEKLWEAEDLIFSVYSLSLGEFWVGGIFGLAHLDNGSAELSKIANGDTIYRIYRARSGAFWFGGRHGAYRLEGGEWTFFGAKQGLSHGQVREFFEEEDGTLWLGTYGGGLIRFLDGIFTPVTMEQGLPDNAISRVIIDEKNQAFINSNRGIFRLDLEDLRSVADGKMLKLSCVRFGTPPNFGTNEAQGGSMLAGSRGLDGTFWFPAIEGLVSLNANTAPPDVGPAPLVIRELRTRAKSYSADTTANLSKGERSFQIDYTALCFRYPEYTRYRYRLNGWDSEWMDVGSIRTARFSGLGPGEYVFQLEAINSESNEPPSAAQVKISIPHFYYETAWFRFAIGMVVVGLLFLLFQWRVHAINARAQMLESIVKHRTQEIDQARQRLEERVIERTTQLAAANNSLQADLAQRKLLEEQLLQVQKLESVGQLAGGIAHDFNNILTVMLGQSELARLQRFDPEIVDSSLMAVAEAGTHAGKLTHQLLTFARRQTVEPKVIDLRRLLLSLQQLLLRIVGDQLDLRVSVSDDLGWVKADPTQLEQVFVNLSINARDAMPNGGQLKIEARNTTTNDGRELVEVMVSDSGTGMSQKTRERIFEPFFSTKPTGQGSGLGLAVCYGIISECGGSIRVTSELGQGSIFTILMPRTQPQESASHDPDDMIIPPTSLRVLLVEDDERVRKVVREMVLNLGCAVTDFASGHDAITHMKQPLIEYDLLLCDIMMPEIRGERLASTLREIDPAIQLIFMTGYAGQNTDPSNPYLKNAGMLTKPFSLQDLRRAFSLLGDSKHNERS